jgi:hypothetical protein
MTTSELMESIRDMVDTEIENLSRGSLRKRFQSQIDARLQNLLHQSRRKRPAGGRGNSGKSYKKISVSIPTDLWQRSQDYPGSLSAKLATGLSIVLDALDGHMG